ncbi:hypothetical protein Csa_023642, partial [Cucumis sativus]
QLHIELHSIPVRANRRMQKQRRRQTNPMGRHIHQPLLSQRPQRRCQGFGLKHQRQHISISFTATMGELYRALLPAGLCLVGGMRSPESVHWRQSLLGDAVLAEAGAEQVVQGGSAELLGVRNDGV